ncbi:hypothetical protein [Streptomyces werraensis]|uniref:hypothetical protein n=1 Tax=Streptomyces werraensis TaxID=68284 RepID=UPI0037FD701F
MQTGAQPEADPPPPTAQVDHQRPTFHYDNEATGAEWSLAIGEDGLGKLLIEAVPVQYAVRRGEPRHRVVPAAVAAPPCTPQGQLAGTAP